MFVSAVLVLSLRHRTHLLHTAEATGPHGRERPLPPAPLLPPRRDAPFSACLLLPDGGSETLGEWLAYHYTAASLRHVIVGGDPRSAASARPLLERWNGATEMDIVWWKDAHYMPTGEALEEKVRKISTRNLKVGNKTAGEMSMVRQEEFMSSCLLAHQKNERKWTMLLDSDEYLVFNTPDMDGKERQHEEAQHLRTHQKEVLERINTLRNGLPAAGRESIAAYADRHRFGLPWIVEPCMPLPRLLFGSVDGAVRAGAPHVFPAAGAATARYRRRARNGGGRLEDRSLVDLSRIPKKSLKNIAGPHRPFAVCSEHRRGELPPGGNISRLDQTLLRVHRYVGAVPGSEDRMQEYEKKDRMAVGNEDDVHPWVTSFVDLVGKEKAQHLLFHKPV